MNSKSINEKLLFFFPNRSSFVERDITLLQSRYRVIPFEFNPSRKILIPFRFISQLLFLCRHIFTSQLLVCQLAAWHSVLPVIFSKLFRKPSIIFLAGTDCAFFPSIRYGNFCKPALARATAFSARNATHLAPKHISLIRAPYTYHPSGFPEQGIACFVSDFATPHTVIPNGFDASEYISANEHRQPHSFLTVAAGIGTSNINQLKGIDLILQAAARFPQCTFTLAGVAKGVHLAALPGNVICLPAQSQQQLKTLYASYQYYLQLSLSEGFPNAVCEAMLSGCVPVVSDVNALPDIAGSGGFVLRKYGVEELEALINRALAADVEALSAQSVQHISKHYSAKQRQTKLFELFDKLTGV